MFTITTEELLASENAISKLFAYDTVPSAVKLRLAPIKRAYDEQIKDACKITHDARLELFKLHGAPSETSPGDYDLLKSTLEQKQAVEDAWRELLDVPVELPGKVIQYETISEGSYLAQTTVNGVPCMVRASLSTADLIQLEWLIKLPVSVEQEAEALAQTVAATA